jgi:hypothetical protein
MGIVVQHQPAAGVIADSSYLGGLGDFQRFILQRQLQQQQLDLQARSSDRNFASDIYGRNLNFASDVMRLRQNQQQFNAQNQINQARINQDAAEMQAQNERALNAQVGMDNRAVFNQQGQTDRLVVSNFQKWSGQHGQDLQGLQSRGQMIANEAAYKEAMAALQATVADENLRPVDKALKIGELQNKIDRMVGTAVPNPQGPPIPLPEKFERETVTRPDGSVWALDQHGVWGQKGDPAPPDPTKFSEKGFQEFYKDFKPSLVVQEQSKNGPKPRPMTVAEARKEYAKWVDQNLRDAHIGYDIARREEEEVAQQAQQVQQQAKLDAELEKQLTALNVLAQSNPQMAQHILQSRPDLAEYLARREAAPAPRPKPPAIGEEYTAPDGTKRRRVK